jgi:hypothetical protein
LQTPTYKPPFILNTFMDSQLTLIGRDAELAAPDPAFGATTILDFDRDVMLSTNATVRGQSHMRYSVRTVRAGLVGMSPKTIISEGERILATVLRRDMVPDLLTLGGESMIRGVGSRRLCFRLCTLNLAHFAPGYFTRSYYPVRRRSERGEKHISGRKAWTAG